MTDGTMTTSDGVRIAYRFDGPETAPVLLMAHSLATSMHLWDPQIASFTREFRVLRYDCRGHGGSSAPAGDYSVARAGQDALDLLDALGLPRVSFCGLSLGGMVGQWLGVNAGARVDRLVVCNSSAFTGAEVWRDRISDVQSKGLEGIVDSVMGRWFTPRFAAAHPEEVAKARRGFLQTNPVGYLGCAAAIRDLDLRSEISSIRNPCLVIGGAEDLAISPDQSAAIAEKIAGSSLVLLPASHISNVECRDEFNSKVLAFLKNG